MWERLRESLARVVPSLEVLEEEVARYDLGAAEKQGVLADLERVYYLTWLMRELGEYFRGKIYFGGGAVLNYVFLRGYGHAPRFTFDLDSRWLGEVKAKRSLLKEIAEFNSYLRRKNPVDLPVSSSKAIPLYTAEYDVEKDFFPDILSLRIPVIMRWSGLEFHRFAYKTAGVEMDYQLVRRMREVFKAVIGIEDALIDYIRFEVSIGEAYPYKSYSVDLPFRLGRCELSITVLEYQLAAKLANRLCRDVGGDLPLLAHDMLKAILDLRLLPHANKAAVKRYAEQLGCTRESLQTVQRNLHAVLNFPEYWKSHHYTLVRREATLESIVREVEKEVQSLFENS